VELIADAAERTTATTDADRRVRRGAARDPPSHGLVVRAAVAASPGPGVVQPADLGTVRLVWTFDGHGLFHLVQLVGLVFLVAGLDRLLARPAPETLR
jgi:hypothetical protein